MKIYMVEEKGGEYEDAYQYIWAICATRARAIAFLIETRKEVNKSGRYSNIKWTVDNKGSGVCKWLPDRIGVYSLEMNEEYERKSYQVYEIEVLE